MERRDLRMGNTELNNYSVLIKGAEAEIVEKKSRFIATIRPVETEEEAQLTRSSDDGEPSGTAGRPMLEVLLGSEIRNIAVVVTRYFGGVLLGTGGLVRAYTQAVQAALEECEAARKKFGVKLKIKTDYNGVGKIQYMLGSKGIAIQDSVYAADVEMIVLVPIEEYDQLYNELVEATNARAGLEELERLYYFE